jgi:hypothetical protein
VIEVTRAREELREGQREVTSKSIIRSVRVCNCRRSGCLKKYCECYKAGEVCSP